MRAKCALYEKDLMFRVYVTDALKIVTENTAHLAGGSTLMRRWVDVIDMQPDLVEDNRPADEVAEEIWTRAGLKKGGE